MALERSEDREPLFDQIRRGEEEVQRLRIDFIAIAEDVKLLARKETELARAEVREQVGHVKRGVMLGGVALVAAALGAVFLLVSVMLILDTFMPLWLAAPITTLGIGAVAVFAAAFAVQHFKRISLTPKRTMQSIREDVTWAKNQMRSSAK